MWPIGVGREIAQIAPLIMTGLSVGFAFKTGLFNIGAAGQYTVGAFGALFFAISAEDAMVGCVCWPLLCLALFGAQFPVILKRISTLTRSSPPSCSTGLAFMR